jgi:elongation factor P
MGSTNDFKIGLTIEFEDNVWKVIEFLHVKPGKGSAFVRSKLKNLQTGSTLEKTWKAGENFPDAQVDKEEMQFSYIDGEEYVFMNLETYEEERIQASDIDKRDFIKDDMQLVVLKWRGKPIDVQVPKTMELKVPISLRSLVGRHSRRPLGLDAPRIMHRLRENRVASRQNLS